MAADPDLVLSTDFAAAADACLQLTPLVRRIVAGNSGPMTFTGTCTYVVGQGEVAVIDPGPHRPEHIDAIEAALAGETVTHIVVSHTHLDHSPGARLLAARMGAPIVGCGPHRQARETAESEGRSIEASFDLAHAPDRELADGQSVEGPGWTLTALATPGHTMNHLAFALPQERALFSADHVMAWSTTVVAPPGGSMKAFMASLEKLKGRDETVYWPGHGGPVADPPRFVRALIHHRRMREASILGRVRAGDSTVPAIVEAIYRGLAQNLKRAAGYSVLAHLEDLAERGLVATDGVPRIEGEFRAG